jgi:hypothetical protein
MKQLFGRVVLFISALSLVFSLQSPVFAQTGTIDQPTNLVRNALSVSDTIPTGSFLSSCDISKGAVDTGQKDIAISQSTASKALVKCIRDIVGLIFAIGVIATAVQIAALQLGILSDAGVGQPIVQTRKKLRGGLIGLFLLGGGFLILQLFYQPIGTFTF